MNFISHSLPSLVRDPVETKLNGFGSLPIGWHYGDGVPPSPATMNRAKLFLGLFRFLGLRQNDVFCSADGDIMVTAYEGDHYLEVDISDDDQTAFSYEYKSASCVKELGSDAKLYSVIAKIAWDLGCNTYGSSIQTTTTNGFSASKATPLKIPLQNGVGQAPVYSSAFVQRLNNPYVSILGNITAAREASHQFSGSLTNQFCREEVA